MNLVKGSKRQVVFEVVHRKDEAFVIESATWEIRDSALVVLPSFPPTAATIDGHDVIAPVDTTDVALVVGETYWLYIFAQIESTVDLVPGKEKLDIVA